MPAYTLEATAEGANTGWTLAAGASKTVAVSDTSDATYLTQSPTGVPSRQSFTMQDLPSDAEAVTAPVTCNCRGKDVTGTVDRCYSHWRYSGANYEDATGWNFSTTIADYTRDWSTGPGGAAWTPAMLNACEMGFARLAGTNFTMAVYKYNVTGNYEQPGATFISIWQVVLPLLGAGLGLVHMRGIAREMARRHQPDGGARVWFRPDEYAEALRVYREWRRPAFAFLGV